MAHLAYFDESGDRGVVNSPTRNFVLSCTLVPEGFWLTSLDALVGLRRTLNERYGVSTRPEMKSTDISGADKVLSGASDFRCKDAASCLRSSSSSKQ